MKLFQRRAIGIDTYFEESMCTVRVHFDLRRDHGKERELDSTAYAVPPRAADA